MSCITVVAEVDQIHPVIEFIKVSKSFGETRVLHDVDVTFSEGQIHVLVGESGSGKTTCLKIMNSLIPHTSGKVIFQGEELDPSQGPSIRRKMGYSQQGNSLFPHMTIYENLTIVARREGVPEAEMQQRATELLDLVHLDPDQYLTMSPRQLSGGQQQRVGIARSLFMRPRLLLMDEPFGALDPMTRDEIQNLFLELYEKEKFTAIIVTHDMPEAFRLADTLTLLHEGRIEQTGAPNDLLLNPSTEIVKKFLQSHSPVGALENIRVRSVMRRSNLETAEGATTSLNEKDDLLKAMTALTDNSGSPVPIYNDDGDLVGVFDRKALDAI